MRIFTIVFTIIAIILIGFNSTKLNFGNIFQGESKVALITILASLCGIVLLQILRISKRIEQLSNRKS